MVSQRCHSRDQPVPTVEEEWQIVPTKWWYTPFSSVSWSYEPEKTSQNVVFAKPPHYHLFLHKEQEQQSFDDQEYGNESSQFLSEWHTSSTSRIGDDDDNALNEELIGVKNAREVLTAYEETAGFGYAPWPSFRPADLEKEEKWFHDVSEADVVLGKERWNTLVNELAGGRSLKKLLEGAKVKPDSAKSLSQRTLATPNNTDYFSRPSTPKPFRLNPSASSFVPLGSPTSTFSSSSCSLSSLDSPDPLGSFSFPSLPSPPNKYKPDYQEHASGLHTRCRTTSSDGSFVASFERPSSGFLPSFLFDSANQRRRPTRTSRTRAIVDQLRSQLHHDGDRTSPVSQNSSPTVSDFGVGNISYFKSRLTISDGSSARSVTPPLTEEDFHHRDGVGIAGWTDNAEGWTIPPAPTEVDQETKRTRSKELLMTLRRRTDSLTSHANAVASLAAARSMGAVSASTPPALIVTERLVASPEPAETVESLVEEEDDLFEMPNRSHQTTSSRVSSPTLHHQRASAQSTTPEVDYVHALPQECAIEHTTTHHQSSVYSQKTTNAPRYSQRYITNPNSGLPYPLFGYPLPVSGVSMNMGLPVQMTVPTLATSTPRAGLQFPVQLPVQIPLQTMQYSTLMHLRIMQQMQMMRNSMNMTAVGGTST